MNHTSLLHLVSLALGACLAAQSQTPKTPPKSQITGFVSQLRKREAGLKSLEMSMATRGAYAGGASFSTAGTLRVLRGTHFHFSLRCEFGGGPSRGGVWSKVEGVLTPEGFWRAEDGPVAGPTYIRMSADLVAELQQAQRALAQSYKAAGKSMMGLPGPLEGQAEAPLGSATLTALDRLFALAPEEKVRPLKGVPCQVLSGLWRGIAGLSEAERKEMLAREDGDTRLRGAYRCEVWLRKSDGIPLRITQYRQKPGVDGKWGEEVSLQIDMGDIKIDGVMEAKSFVLKVPEGQVFTDALEHRPSQAQIQRLRDEYKALKEEEARKNR